MVKLGRGFFRERKEGMGVGMIVEFLNRGKGGGSGGIEYVVGKEGEGEEGRLLGGEGEERGGVIKRRD